MKLALRIINIFTLALLLFYIVFTHQYYSLILRYSDGITSDIYTYSNRPYYILWISIVLNVMFVFFEYINSKKVHLLTKTTIFVVLFFIMSIVFTPKFEFLHQIDIEGGYPISYRYDKLFVYNKFYSNEGDYEGGYGDTKYLYIPVINKIVYFKSFKVDVYDIEYISDGTVKIGNKKYSVESSWFTES